MRIAYLPDDYVTVGEILGDSGPQPRRYMTSVVTGLSMLGKSVDTVSVEPDDAPYTWLRILARHRYRRYIWAKALKQALTVMVPNNRYDIVIAGQASASACLTTRSLLPHFANKSLIGVISYAPQERYARVDRGRSRPDFIIGVSEAQAIVLAQTAGVSINRIITIPMGVDTNFFAPPQQRPPRKHIICVGDAKRDEALLAKIADGLPLPLVRVTPDPIPSKSRADGIVYVSGVDATTLRSLYERAAIALVPTTSSFDIPGLTSILEAQAMGVPVIATRTLATAEYVRHGETGFIVEPSDPAELKEAVWNLWQSNKLDRFGRQARAFVERGHRIRDGIAALEAGLEALDCG